MNRVEARLRDDLTHNGNTVVSLAEALTCYASSVMFGGRDPAMACTSHSQLIE